MKILYEAGHLLGIKTGIGHYTQNLLKALLEIDTTNEYRLFGFYSFTKKFAPPLQKLPKNARWRLIRYFPGWLYEFMSRRGFPPPIDLLAFYKPDIALFTNYVRTPLLSRKPIITVVYDLSFSRYQQFAYRKVFSLYKKQLPYTIKKSARIITISATIKNELLEDYDVDPNKIAVLHPGADTQRFYKRPQKEITRIRKKYAIPKKYILYTGTLEPRKNIAGLVKAYKKLPQDIRDEYCLVLAGGFGYHDEEMHKAFRDAKARGLNIIRTGYVPDEDQPALYSGAALYVFVSHYEGFGMTPIEAMLCEVPVVASDTSSIPEAVGNAAYLVRPDQPAQIARGMQKVLGDQSLRRNLIQLGKKQAKKYQWKHSAQQLYNILQELHDEQK